MSEESSLNLNTEKAERLRKWVARAGHILLFTHRLPDGDAIGSLTAIMNLLDGWSVKYTAFCIDRVPQNLIYLYRAYKIQHDLEILKKENYDLIIGLDCGSLEHSGMEVFLRNLRQTALLANIDHHPSAYGDLNLVFPTAPATAMILYKLFKQWQVNLNKEMALSLLAGIVADTNNYTNSSTTVEALEVSAELIRAGANYGQINRYIYRTKDEKVLAWWAKLLSRVKKNDKLKVVYTVILPEDEEKLSRDKLDGATNFFNHVEGARMSLVLRQLSGNRIKASLRSIDQKLDVSKVARWFGGGGHSKAAGFIINGRLEEEGGVWRVI